MRLIIDTDPAMGTLGTDPEDGMAILYALNAPDVQVDGLTLVQGNVPISHSWPNARHLLALAGHPEIPLHAGAVGPRDPDRRRLQTAWLDQRATAPRTAPPVELPEGGLGNTATAFLCRTVLEAAGEITVVAIGPLTNIAAAIEAEPDVATAMASLVIMGGTVAVPGNVTPAAEFNIWMDPGAADIVFRSGAPITMVGLDVCHQTSFDRDRAARLRRNGSPLAGFVADAAESWIDVREQLFPEHEALHLYDTLAVAAAIEPDLLQTRGALVEVETSDGPAQGMTVTYLNDVLRQLLTGRDPNAAVAVGVDSARFAARFDERVAGCL
ncbi:MAG: nucleoside hydrolase [Mycobacteriaceae bacterium]